MKEELLEPLLRRMRISRILPILHAIPDCILLDIGCGWEARFLQDAAPYIQSGVGVDFKAPEIKTDKLYTVSTTLHKALPFPDKSFDVVTMLAVLEHIEHDDAIVREVRRVLRPGGKFVGTVPSKFAKPLLEFLSFKLHIVNPAEILDHKRYYDKKTLQELLLSVGFKTVQHHYFQCGMNNFFSAEY